MDRHEERIAKEMGYDKKKPLIQFYDHAIPDHAETQRCGRPRFKSAVYIQKIPSAEDLIVRDVFSRKAEEQDELDHPKEWALYLERKANLDNGNPPVTGLPGMHIAAVHELRALGIHTCRQFVEYDGDLDVLEPLRAIAQEVLAIGNPSRTPTTGAGNLHQGRHAVQNGVERRPHLYAETGGPSPEGAAQASGASGAGAGSAGTGGAAKESGQKESNQKEGGQKEGEQVETFRWTTEATYQWH